MNNTINAFWVASALRKIADAATSALAYRLCLAAADTIMAGDAPVMDATDDYGAHSYWMRVGSVVYVAGTTASGHRYGYACDRKGKLWASVAMDGSKVFRPHALLRAWQHGARLSRSDLWTVRKYLLRCAARAAGTQQLAMRAAAGRAHRQKDAS